jgi:hypothetical protein
MENWKIVFLYIHSKLNGLSDGIVVIAHLLSGDSVSATVSGKRLGKHVPDTTNTHVTIELLLEAECFLCDPML